MTAFNTPWRKFRLLWLPLVCQLAQMSSSRLDAVIKTVPGVTGMVDDVLAKKNCEINHDIAVFSLPDTAKKQQPGVQH